MIIGQGPLEAELRARHAALDLGAHVADPRLPADAPRISAAADLFVLASHHEGIPVAVMEALAAGVPVVATAVGGLAEAVQPGESGRLVPAHRPDLLADAIVDLATDPDERARLVEGAGGRRRPVLGAPLRARDRGRLPTGGGGRRLRSTTRAGTPTAVTPSGTSLDHDCSGPDHRPRSDRVAGRHHRAGAEERPVTDDRRAVHEHARAERGVLADHAVVGDDRVHVDLGVVARCGRWS